MIKYRIIDNKKKSENIVNKKGLREFVILNDLCVDTMQCGFIGIDNFSIKKFNHLVYSLNKGTKFLYCEHNVFIERVL